VESSDREERRMPTVVKNFNSPDETRPFDGKGKADVCNLAGKVVSRGVFEPGWKWSENVKPIAGTDSCKFSHLGYCMAGRMKVYMDDGSQAEIGPATCSRFRPATMPRSWARSRA